jgi:aspartyl-tRNA synthetase
MLRTHYVNELDQRMDGKEVTLCGWVHELRETGKITFLILRDRSGIVQVIAKDGVVDAQTKNAMSLPKESVVQVTGIVKANPEAKKGFEIIPKSVINLNPLSAPIPFEVTGKVPADIDVRLDYRYIDLRRMETTAIFKIQSTILQSFREFLAKRGFYEIRTPSIVAEATEGGADVFQVQYFERKAYLAQSPQLYKQLAVIGGLDKVVMVVDAFRAERSNTTYHITQCTQMDIEMAFANADDVTKLLGQVLVYIVKSVLKKNKAELELLGSDLKVPKVRKITYAKAVRDLAKAGEHMKKGDDFNRELEIALGKLYGDAVLVRDYPTAIRAFYSMPKENDRSVSTGFDMIYKGLEICSGAQRIHIPDMLISALKDRNIDPKQFEFYINAFRCGAPPHSGWSIGLERLTMMVVGAKNIREATLFPRDPKRLTP